MKEAIFDMALGERMEVGRELPEQRTGSKQRYRPENVELVVRKKEWTLVAGAQHEQGSGDPRATSGQRG